MQLNLKIGHIKTGDIKRSNPVSMGGSGMVLIKFRKSKKKARPTLQDVLSRLFDVGFVSKGDHFVFFEDD